MSPTRYSVVSLHFVRATILAEKKEKDPVAQYHVHPLNTYQANKAGYEILHL